MTAATANASSLHCRSLTVDFGRGKRAVDQAELFVPGGEIFSLVGRSGCGKTTLLRAIAGLQPVGAGSVTFDPRRKIHRGEVAFVFQQPALLPWRTALENVVLPLELAGIGDRLSRRSEAEEMLQAVELGDAMEHRPGQLSGGMRMRVSLARALVTSPAVLLLDEPFASLDDMLRNQLGQLLLSLWRSRRFTAVMVTHNIAEAVLLSHRVVIMQDGKLGKPIPNPLPDSRDEELRRTAAFGQFYGVISDALRGVDEA